MAHISAVFGARVKQARKRLDMSQAALAAAVTDLGQPLDNLAISRIENGVRKVSLGEFVVISTMLRLRVHEALTPTDPDVERVSIGDSEDSQTASVEDLVAWASGKRAMFSEPWLAEEPSGSPLGEILRNLANEADRSQGSPRSIEVAEAGIAVLQGAVPALKISVRGEAKGAKDGAR